MNEKVNVWMQSLKQVPPPTSRRWILISLLRKIQTSLLLAQMKRITPQRIFKPDTNKIKSDANYLRRKMIAEFKSQHDPILWK